MSSSKTNTDCDPFDRLPATFSYSTARAAGLSNARIYKRPGLTFRPVPDLPPAELAIAWRRTDPREIVHLFVDSVGG